MRLNQFIDLGVLLTRDDIFPPKNSLFFHAVGAQSGVTEIPRRVFFIIRRAKWLH